MLIKTVMKIDLILTLSKFSLSKPIIFLIICLKNIKYNKNKAENIIY
jgi:hypothetical protein